MTLGEGSTIWGARFAQSGQVQYSSFTLSSPVGEEGGTAQVYKVLPRSTPPLVAKIFLPKMLERVQTESGYAKRYYFLAKNIDTLEKELPFATWPRRLLFTKPNIVAAEARRELRGFTMQALLGTTSLMDIINIEHTRFRLTWKLTYDVAVQLAERIAIMHRHKWAFVIGDLSPNNVHISHDFQHVLFIDTDGFQFDYEDGNHAVGLFGHTKGFTSPTPITVHDNFHRATPAHDDFVLAILLFCLFMAKTGYPAHPFRHANLKEDDLIAARQFVFDNNAFKIHKDVRAAYMTLPETLRQAFTRTFTAQTPITAHEWTGILKNQRRLL